MWWQADAPTKDKLKLKDTHEELKLKTKHKGVTKIKQEVQNPKHRVGHLPVRHTESRITESRKTITTTDDSRTRSNSNKTEGQERDAPGPGPIVHAGFLISFADTRERLRPNRISNTQRS